MSPNKTDNKDENYQINENNQFIYQFQDQSDDDEQILNNGYTLLNQDQDQNQFSGNDESDDDESLSESDNEEIKVNNDLNQNINIINFDDDGNVISEDKFSEDNSIKDSRLKTYLNANQLDEINFQREWDKKEKNSNQLNSINLNEDNIDKIKECMKSINLPSIPDWANKIPESNLTNFIYKRLASDKRT